MSKPTIKDVAQLAKVSVGTVSMVLNNSTKIKPSTKATVLSAIEQLQYKRNPYARSLSLSRSHMIGVVITDLTNPFFGMMVEHLQKEIDMRGYSMMLGVSQDAIRMEKKAVEHLLNSGVDGMILVPAFVREPNISHIHDMVDRNFPFVFISTYYPGVKAGCVMTDLAKGSYDMTLALLKAGHRQIFFIGGFQDLVLSQMRLEGFMRAHQDMGLSVNPRQVVEVPLPNYQCGYDAAKTLLAHHKPDAIMTINDVLCMGVMGYLREEGIRVPDEISVAGYDDLSYSSMINTSLTTVCQPVQQICAGAVDMLFSMMEGEEAAQTVLLSPKLVIRQSARIG